MIENQKMPEIFKQVKNIVLSNEDEIKMKFADNFFPDDLNEKITQSINNCSTKIKESEIKYKNDKKQCIEEGKNMNDEELISFPSEDFYTHLIDDDEDQIESNSKTTFLNLKNDDEDSEQEDLILIREENSDNYNKQNIVNNKDPYFNFALFSETNAEKTYNNENESEDKKLTKIKEQMNLNKQKISKTPSYPLNLNILDMNSNHFSSQNNLHLLNHKIYISPCNSYNQLPNNIYLSSSNLNFLNNSFTMNGKSGWICPDCKNFNYEMRIKCNRCGRPQILYQNQNFNSHLSLDNNMLQSDIHKNKSNHNLNNNYSIFSSLQHTDYHKKGDDKKKQKNFIEREGDWICNKCKNLNFAFRKNCNRCKLPKKICVSNSNNIRDTYN